MISTSLTAWILFATALAVASAAGISLSAFAPWSSAARRANIPLAFGLAGAPLLLGLFSAAALIALPGASYSTHLSTIALLCLAIVAFTSWKRPAREQRYAFIEPPTKGWEWVLLGLLVAWAAVLIVDALFIPFLQNDALEYAMVGRRLFFLRDISAYPALDPINDPSGFYGPWTHPPLYAALIYLTYVFQGHANSPDLMRLISPWILLVTAGLVYAIGRLADKTTGLLAALFLLATPLLFLGSGSALIDVVPVLGLAMILCTVIGLDGSPGRLGVVQGIVLGAALWTHSQAVLFVPLILVAIAAQSGCRRVKQTLFQAAIVLGIAVLISAWPYLQNFRRFGAIVSDNPAVFAMPELDWNEYFRMSRGMESWPERIQYGIFKGWSAFEAYALSFWFMTLGIALSFAEIRERRNDTTGRWRLVLLAIVTCYLGGMSLSTLMGIDQMIKTERYLLVIMPCVALLAGWGVSRWISKSRVIVPALKVGLTLMFLVQLFVIGGYLMKDLGNSFVRLLRPAEEKLALWPPYGAIRYLRENERTPGLVLSLKPSDMYYTNRKMVSFLDPRLLPFYRESDPVTGWKRLRDLGVTMIYAPDYSLPPLYNSILLSIMGRPDLTKLVFSENGYQIYELTSEGGQAGNEVLKTEIDVSPGSVNWTQSQGFVFGGRKRLSRYTASSNLLNPGDFSSPRHHFLLFRRDWSIRMDSDAIPLPEHKEPLEYRLELELEGHAFVQIYLTHLDIHSNQIVEEALGGTTLGNRHPKRLFVRRFIVDPGVSSIRVGVEHRGDTAVRIARAALSPIL